MRFGTVADEMAALAESVESNPGGWAVIARTNVALNNVQLALDEADIPYVRSGTGSIWRVDAVAVFLGVLGALSRSELLGLEQALFWAKAPPDLLESSVVADALREPNQRTIAALREQHRPSATFAAHLPAWRAQMSKGNHMNVMAGVYDWMDSYFPGKRRGASEPAGRAAGERYRQFKKAFQIFSEMRGTLPERLRQIQSKEMQRQAKDSDGAVYLLTMHASKGLEFDNVWLSFADAAKCPHESCTDEDEERRLFYVAMTRARNRLVISSAPDRPGEGDYDSNIPSPFTMQAGLDPFTPGQAL